MIFTKTSIEGAYVIDLEKRVDDRGFFARMACADEFKAHGLELDICQVNDALSSRRGTLRGMHFQLPPFDEIKMVRCLAGACHDVTIDLRRGSPTFRQSFGLELSAENRSMIYIPPGVAHGFLTLTENTELIYFTSKSYSPAHDRGIRYDDPFFNIRWPFEPSIVSDRDRAFPSFDPSLLPW